MAESGIPQVNASIELLRSHSPSRDFLADLRAALGFGPGAKLAVTHTRETDRLTEVTRGRFPARGLLYSFLAHEAAIIALLVIPGTVRPERKFYEFDRWMPLDAKLTYSLPELGGGQKGGGKPGGKSGGGSPKRASASPAPAPKKEGGLVYPAPQPVISVPPNATNRIQTILQPDLVNPPELNVPLPLPNVVQLARGPRLPAPPPLVPKVDVKAVPPARPPEAPKLRAEARPPSTPYALPLPNAPPLIENPQLTLPPATPEPPKEVAYQPTVPQIAPMSEEARVTAAQAPSLALPGGAGGTDDRSILVLSPTPGPPDAPLNVPRGEARGQFAMGPEANLKGSSSQPPGDPMGIEGGTGSGPAGANGTGSGSGAGEGGGGGGTGKGTGSGAGDGVGPGTGTGSGTGTGTGSGSGIDGTGGGGSGSGTGTGTGSGPGRGEGTGSGTGTGSGSGSGTNPFPGISIVGGSGSTGAVGGTRSRTRKPPGPTPTYGMTVVSTAASGGGLRDYGIFRNESVFTVYVPMTHSPTPAPSWTLQYAVLKRPSTGSGTITLGSGSVKMQGQIVAPFPIDKENPEFPEEVVSRNLGRLIVVYAEITSEGKVENSRIIQSPNALLNQPVLEALARWTFRPAESNGQPVAVKALLGIPLSLPH